MKVLLFIYNIMTEAEKQIVKDTVWAYIKVIALFITVIYVLCGFVLIYGNYVTKFH